MRLIILTVVVIVAIFVYLGYDSQKAIEDCKRAGVQSDDTCEFYAR